MLGRQKELIQANTSFFSYTICYRWVHLQCTTMFDLVVDVGPLVKVSAELVYSTSLHKALIALENNQTSYSTGCSSFHSFKCKSA